MRLPARRMDHLRLHGGGVGLRTSDLWPLCRLSFGVQLVGNRLCQGDRPFLHLWEGDLGCRPSFIVALPDRGKLLEDRLKDVDARFTQVSAGSLILDV